MIPQGLNWDQFAIIWPFGSILRSQVIKLAKCDILGLNWQHTNN